MSFRKSRDIRAELGIDEAEAAKAKAQLDAALKHHNENCHLVDTPHITSYWWAVYDNATPEPVSRDHPTPYHLVDTREHLMLCLVGYRDGKPLYAPHGSAEDERCANEP